MFVSWASQSLGIWGVLCIVTFSYFVVICTYRLFFHPLSNYPGPFLAKLSDLYSAYQNYHNKIHIDILKCHQLYGDFVRYGPNKLLVNTSSGFHDIYGHNKNVTKSEAYNVLTSRGGGFSILTAREKREHGKKRKLIAQGFSETAVRGYEHLIKVHVEIFCKLMLDDAISNSKDDSSWSSPRDLSLWCSYLSFDIMTDIIFSTRMRLLTEPAARHIVNAINDFMQGVGIMSQVPIWKQMRLDNIFLRHTVQGEKVFRREASRIAIGRLKQEDKVIQDIYQKLVDATDPETELRLSLKELLANTGLLIVAGSDTTSSALAATFFYLSRNHLVYKSVVNEVRTTFTSTEEIATGSQLQSCIYLHACINEALRLSPPVSAALWREVQHGGLKIDNRYIPYGTSVGTSVYALHHNPDNYVQPFQYLPERWIKSDDVSQEEINTAKRAFAPFLIGPRMCVAQRLAMTELLITIAHVLYSLDLKVSMGKEGLTGQGRLGMGSGREREDEYQLYSQFVTVAKKGPVLQFRRR